MIDFNISIVVEHGYPHYKIINMETNSEAHCDLNELNDVIKEMSDINYLSYVK